MPVIYLKPKADEPFYSSFVFPGGEPQVRWNIKALQEEEHPFVTLQMQRFDYPLLATAVDALRRTDDFEVAEIELYLPYFPGARQDRVCAPGEALGARVFADMVNSLMFDRVTIMDPHSDVTPALIERCEVIPHGTLRTGELGEMNILDLLREDGLLKDDIFVVAPDAGASKKVQAAIKRSLHFQDHPYDTTFVQGGKQRDPQTGFLKGFTVDLDDFEGCPVVILDDINSNGGTFIGLSKLLKERNAGAVTLYTTHSDHDIGIENVIGSEFIDAFVTTNSQGPWLEIFGNHPDIKIIDAFV